MKLLSTILMGLTLTACASSQPAATRPVSNQPFGSTSGLQALPASSWQVVYNGRSMSLPEILTASGKSAAIFQFAGVTCVTCQRDAQEYTSRIQRSALKNKLAHIVVFTDFSEDFQENDFASFMNQYAPQSIRTQDSNGRLWLSLQKDPSMPDRNVMVVLGQNGKGLSLNEATSHDLIFTTLEGLASGAL